MAHARHKVIVLDTADPETVERQLDKQAAQGWELVSLTQVPVLSLVAVFRKAGD
jgi:hypothetical protein